MSDKKKNLQIDGSTGNGLTVDLINQPMKTVKEVCELLKITRKTLFYYDKISLVKPTIRVGSQNHKMYGDKALKQLAIICLYRKAGFRIEEIKKINQEDSYRKVQKRLEEEKEILKSREMYLAYLKDRTKEQLEDLSIKELVRLLEEDMKNEID